MRWQDIDFPAGELHVRQTLQRVTSGLVYGHRKRPAQNVRFRCRSPALQRWCSTSAGRISIGLRRGRNGRIWTWSSPQATAHRLSLEISTGHSRPCVSLQGCDRSGFMICAIPARHCSTPRAWSSARFRMCSGTHRSPSPRASMCRCHQAGATRGRRPSEQPLRPG